MLLRLVEASDYYWKSKLLKEVNEKVFFVFIKACDVRNAVISNFCGRCQQKYPSRAFCRSQYRTLDRKLW